MDHLIDDSDRLKPCPFCGSDAEFGQIGSDQETPDAGGCFVQCLNSACGASSALIFPLMDDVKELLMERWNKRPNGHVSPARRGINPTCAAASSGESGGNGG